MQRCCLPARPEWRQAPHLSDDRTCFYLAEAAKEGAEARLTIALTDDLAEPVTLAHREIINSAEAHSQTGRGRLRKTLLSAAESASRMRRPGQEPA